MELTSNDVCRLFPDRTSLFVFWAYISLFVSQGLLVTAVQNSRIYGFNSAVIVLSTEFVKLFICIIIYLLRPDSGGFAGLLYDIKKNYKLFYLYLVPAFLYCLYNNLTFINLKLFDLATYYCLMQFRIVLTAVLYQVLFKRQLTLTQWVSLLILTAGCLIKEYGWYDNRFDKQNTFHMKNYTESRANETMSDDVTTSGRNSVAMYLWSSSLLLVQMFCSCFAGVYNEYLLKDSSTAKDADVILQNMFMYFNSMICNLIAYILVPMSDQANIGTIGTLSTLYNLLTSPMVMILIFNNALSGLVASFFLKRLNSILKTFASALELFAVTFLAWIIFNNSVDVHTINALVLVSVAMVVYSRNPVSVAPPDKTIDSRDGFVLLPTSED